MCSSGSSGPDEIQHFTATVEGQQQTRNMGQEMIGSYLARQEFSGSNGEQAMGDSGYMSHSSGGKNAAPRQSSALRVIFVSRYLNSI